MRCTVTGVIRIAFFITAIIIFYLQSGVISANKTADKIVDRVEKTIKKIETISCSFRQEYIWKAADRTRIISGTLHTKAPSKLRVEYPAQTIVADGETVWQYIPKNNQVTIQGYEEGEEMFPTPHSIFIRHITRGEITYDGEEKIDDRECDKLHIVTQGNERTDVTVWIDKKLYFPIKSVEEKEDGDILIYVLTDVELNKKIDDEVFTFITPDGVDIVDMRD
ncbi:MAG: outer membrane lipoprotein carrier protein LolA [Candidatus Latescibacteria bacterium]|nr:outer membrane lipoprotein carrier protein LolA [Candidatus Latescibacterota bacterium]